MYQSYETPPETHYEYHFLRMTTVKNCEPYAPFGIYIPLLSRTHMPADGAEPVKKQRKKAQGGGGSKTNHENIVKSLRKIKNSVPNTVHKNKKKTQPNPAALAPLRLCSRTVALFGTLNNSFCLIDSLLSTMRSAL